MEATAVLEGDAEYSMDEMSKKRGSQTENGNKKNIHNEEGRT